MEVLVTWGEASAQAFGDHARLARDNFLICFLLSKFDECRTSLSNIAWRYRISNLECRIVIVWTGIFSKISSFGVDADKIIRIIIRMKKYVLSKMSEYVCPVLFVLPTTSDLIADLSRRRSTVRLCLCTPVCPEKCKPTQRTSAHCKEIFKSKVFAMAISRKPVMPCQQSLFCLYCCFVLL